MAAAEQKPDTDQRILDLNLTDQGYRVGACGCCCRHQVFGPSERGGAAIAERICSRGRRGLSKKAAATFFVDCEMDHI
jgi:hypothetical protein